MRIFTTTILVTEFLRLLHKLNILRNIFDKKLITNVIININLKRYFIFRI